MNRDFVNSTVTTSQSPTTELNWLLVISAVIMGFLAILIIAGNGIVMFYFGRKGRYNISQNFFIIQLALADLILGVTILSLIPAVLNPQIQRNLTVCLLKYTLPMYSMGSSIVSLLCLSGDRYMAIHRPMTYKDTMTFTQRCISLAGIWGLSTCVCFLLPFFWNEGWNRGDDRECTFMLIMKDEFSIYFIFPCSFTSAFILFWFYARIFMTAARQARQIQAQETVIPRNQIKKELKATKTVAMVLGIFYLCWLPNISCLSIQVILKLHHNQSVNAFRTFLVFLAQFNSAMNPIIYNFRMPKFRQEVKKLFSWK